MYAYVKRDDTPDDLYKIIKESSANCTLCLYNDKTGISRFLLETEALFDKKKEICFFIDAASASISYADQIVRKITGSTGDLEEIINKETSSKRKKEILKSVLGGVVKSSVAVVGGKIIADFASVLVDSVKKTLNVSIEHSGDFKFEKAIIDFVSNIYEKHDKKTFFVVDNALNVDLTTGSFFSQMIKNKGANFLFALNNVPGFKMNVNSSEMRIKIKSLALAEKIPAKLNEFNLNELNEKFVEEFWSRYNDETIPYGASQLKNIYQIIELVERVDEISTDASAIINILNCLESKHLSNAVVKITLNLLLRIFNIYKTSKFDDELERDTFVALADSLVRKTLIQKNDNLYYANYNSTRGKSKTDTVETLLIKRSIFEVLKNECDLTCEQRILSVELAIEQNAPTAAKKLLFNFFEYEEAVANKSKKIRDYSFPTSLLNNFHIYDTLKDLLDVCIVYFNKENPRAALERLQKNINLKDQNPRAYDTMQALCLEQIKQGSFKEQIEHLVSTSKNIDEKCLLVSVLFGIYSDNNDKSNYDDIVSNTNSPIHHLKFINSKYYIYLLSNVAFHKENLEEGSRDYKGLLSKINRANPILYQRISTNYLGYLIARSHETGCRLAKKELETLIEEIQNEIIVHPYDNRCNRLYVNYGIYLMLYTTEDPTPFFDRIPYQAEGYGVTYITAQRSKAMYFAKIERADIAINIMDKLYNDSIENIDVNGIKNNYHINYALLKYIERGAAEAYDYLIKNGIKSDPVGNRKKLLTNALEFYKTHDKAYEAADWSKLARLRYSLYRHADPALLVAEI